MNNGNNDTSKNKNNNRQIKPKSKHFITGTAIFIAAILVISGTNMVAFADFVNVVNEVDVSVTQVTITAGQSVTVFYRISPSTTGGQDPNDPQNGCNANGPSPATVSVGSLPTGITVSPSSRQYTSCTSQAFVYSTTSETTPTTYTIPRVTVSDPGTGTYDTSGSSFMLKVDPAPVTNNKPIVTVPTSFTFEGNELGGANVPFPVSASDPEDGSLSPSCDHQSGDFFPLGATTVTCSATDSGNPALSDTKQFIITVVDTTRPTLNLPSTITAEATGPSGAAVTYTATATDLVDGTFAASCEPPSSSTFALGSTTVNCGATDRSGNTASGSFTVTVVDTKPPEIATKADLTVGATSASGAIVEYSNPTATDTVDTSVDVSCIKASGQTFPIGITTVKCTAKDDSGNTATSEFKVTVNIPSVQFPLPPVNPDGSSTYKKGSTIPFKLGAQYAGGAQASDLSITLIISKTGQADGDPVNEAASTVPPTDGTLFRWDSTGQQYIYNLASRNLADGVYKAWATVNGFAIIKDVAFTIRK